MQSHDRVSCLASYSCRVLLLAITLSASDSGIDFAAVSPQARADGPKGRAINAMTVTTSPGPETALQTVNRENAFVARVTESAIQIGPMFQVGKPSTLDLGIRAFGLVEEALPLAGAGFVPKGLPALAWERIQVQLGQADHAVRSAGPDRFVARNRSHRFVADFTSEGVVLRPAEGSWVVRQSLVAWGREGAMRLVPGSRPEASMVNRVEYQRGALTEWYVSDARGLEQGFTLAAPPEGAALGDLLVEMELVGSLQPDASVADAVVLRDDAGEAVLRYEGLRAWDANGRTLPARLALREGGGAEEMSRVVHVALRVDDRDAVYPVIIDPTWVEVKKIVASDGSPDDWFGRRVSLSGDTAIVGAPLHNGSNGAVYVFDRNQGGTNNWGQVKKLVGLAGTSFFFGDGVSLSGDTAVVGARGDAGNVPGTGAAYVFQRNQGGANNWGLVKKIKASDGTASDQFGISVSVRGDTAIVGASLDDNAGASSGSAYVFDRNQGGANNWGQVKKLVASDGAAADQFGDSVSVSGDTAIVGAPTDDDAGLSSGSAYVIDRNQGGANNWGEVKKLVASDGTAGDTFGRAVSVEGNTAVVGANNDDAPVSDSGSAYVFDRLQGGVNNWGEVDKLVATDGDASDSFAQAVSVYLNTVMVGAPFDNDAGSNSGSAYFFMAPVPVPSVSGTGLAVIAVLLLAASSLLLSRR
jgi:hypothetical protein